MVACQVTWQESCNLRSALGYWYGRPEFGQRHAQDLLCVDRQVLVGRLVVAAPPLEHRRLADAYQRGGLFRVKVRSEVLVPPLDPFVQFHQMTISATCALRQELLIGAR